MTILKQKWFEEEIAGPKRRPTLPGILSAEEITRILDHSRNLKPGTMRARLYATALRCDELRYFQVSDIDSQRRVLQVRPGQGGMAPDIARSPVLLERWKVYYRWRRPTDGLFPSKPRQDQALDRKSIWSGCGNAGKRAGILRPVCPHLFGHACAPPRLEAGADLRPIPVLLGHSDIRTTARYRNVSRQRLPAIRSPLDALQLKPLDRSEEDGRQRGGNLGWKSLRSLVDTNRSFWYGGAIRSGPTSARRSETCAPAEPPLWAHASHRVIPVPTRTSFSSPAAIARVPSASPGLGKNGSPPRPTNSGRFPTPLSPLRCRSSCVG